MKYVQEKQRNTEDAIFQKLTCVRWEFQKRIERMKDK